MDRETRRFVLGGAVGLGAALFAHYELVTRHRFILDELRSEDDQKTRFREQPQERPEPEH